MNSTQGKAIAFNRTSDLSDSSDLSDNTLNLLKN